MAAGCIEVLGLVTRPAEDGTVPESPTPGSSFDEETTLHATATLEAIANKAGYWEMVAAADAKNTAAAAAQVASAPAGACAGAGAGAGAGGT